MHYNIGNMTSIQLSDVKYNYLDLLRFIALIGVLLFHSFPNVVQSGFAGVDVFFVLSGFLVYKKIRDLDFSNSRHVVEFYVGRILRLAPTYLLVITATYVGSYLLGLQSLFTNYVRDALSSTMFLSNVRFWKFLGDYWGEHDSFLLHTWSLSVEEQWYLCLPVALLVVPRSGRTHVFFGLGAISLLGFLFLTIKGSTASFYLLGTRMWEFIAGASLVFFPTVRYRIHRHLSWIGCIAILVLYFVPLPTVVSVLIACTISVLVITSESCSSTESNTVIVTLMRVGRMAYPIYLWHWPIDVLFKYAPPFSVMSVLQRGICEIIISLIFGILTSRCVEFPLRYEKRAVVPICCIYLLLFGGLFSTRDLRVLRSHEFVPPMAEGKKYSISQVDERFLPSVLGVPATMTVDRDLLDHGAIEKGQGQERVLIIGDSHATSWAKTLCEYFRPYAKYIKIWCAAGISPLVEIPISRDQHPLFLTPEQKFKYDKSRLDLITSGEIDVLVLVGYWDSLEPELLYANLRNFSQHCKHIVLVGQAPVLKHLNLPVYESLVWRHRGQQEHKTALLKPAIKTTKSDKVMRACSRITNCIYLPTRSVLSAGESVLVSDGKDVYYLDEDHLSDAGANFVMRKLRSQFLDGKFSSTR